MLVEQTDIQAIISIFGEEDILAELESEARNKIVDRRILVLLPLLSVPQLLTL